MSDLSVTGSYRDQVSKGLAELLKTTKRWGSSMSSSVLGLTRSFVSLRSAVVGVATVWGARLFSGFVASSAETVAELDNLARSMGVSTASLSEMQYALQSVGLKTADASDLFRTFARSIAQAAEGSASQQTALRSLGLDLDKLRSGNVDLVGLLGDVSDGLAGMGTEAEKTGVLVKLFGEKGQRLIPFLSQGREEIERFAAEAERMGVSVDAGTARISRSFLDAKAKFSAAFEGVKRAVSTELYEVLARSFDKLAEYMARNRDEIVKSVRQVSVWAVGALEGVAKAILGVVETLAWVATYYDTREAKIAVIRRQVEAEKELAAVQAKMGSETNLQKLRELNDEAWAKTEELNRLAKALDGFVVKKFDKERAAIEHAAEELRKLLAKPILAPEGAPAPGPEAPRPSYKGRAPEPPVIPPGMAVKPPEETPPQTEWQKFSEGMRSGVDEFNKYATDTTQIAKDTMGAALGWTTEIMTQGFADMVTGAKSAGAAFQEMGRGMLATIAQLLIRMAMLKAISSIFGINLEGGAPQAPAGSRPQAGGYAPAMAAGAGIGATSGGGGAGGGGALLGSGGGVSVTFNVNTIDSKGFREVAHRDRAYFVGMIEDAISRRPAFRRAVGNA